MPPSISARSGRHVGRNPALGCGFQLIANRRSTGTGRPSWLGGNLGWWDAQGYAVGYVTRRLGDHARIEAIEAVLRDVLARR